jgi:hypothetical protein
MSRAGWSISVEHLLYALISVHHNARACASEPNHEAVQCACAAEVIRRAILRYQLVSEIVLICCKY